MDDLISRQAAIDVVIDLCRHYTPTKSVNHPHVDFVIEALQDLPPAEPKRGKWERDGHHIKCDQCGEWMCDRDREGWDIPKNYCPNCGAKMRQREE